MYNQYRYKGHFVSAQTAARLGNLRSAAPYLTTIMREKPAGPAYLEKTGYVKKDSIEARTFIAMESDRRRRDAELREKREQRERARGRERERYLAGPEKQYVPRYEPEEFERVPYQALRYEDELLDDYFDEAIDVADIDGDVYEAGEY